MSSDVREVAGQIIQRLKEQLKCYDSIEELNADQKKAIEEENTNDLMAVVSRKQKYLTQVDNFQKQLLELKNQWDQVKDFAPEDIKQELKENADAVEKKLKSIVAMEQNIISMAEDKKNNVNNKIKDLQFGKTVIKNYLNSEKRV